MKLKLNGSLTEHRDGETVTGLLEKLSIRPEGVAVEVNLEIVRKRDYGSHVLREGDSVEIVNFVGGG
jgi:sulfur carrier protein